MAGSVNKVILVGNLGKDPDIRFMPDGTKVAGFSLATGESWKDKTTGERKEKTEWHRISVMNDRLAEIVEKYVKKGSKVYIEGQLQTRKYTDNSGVEKYSTEIVLSRFRGELVLLDAKGSHANDDMMVSDSAGGVAPRGGPQSFQDLDDEVPF